MTWSGLLRRFVRPHALTFLSGCSFVSRAVAYSSNARRTSGARSGGTSIRTPAEDATRAQTRGHQSSRCRLCWTGAHRARHRAHSPHFANYKPGPSDLALPPAAGPTIFVAVREELGLKLEPVDASMAVIVIDQAERPH